ncbi:hypothetical protein NA647_10555 [Pseudomonas stutzeri]|uniref:hypothetical protein n=1 Tax=Stutzerimonas stutzeri TaxID=316 RepID=UPI00210BD98F|nr:hypothetical protein [Stutzerimonas stutzeri]MCQ4287871.1 hypothetical protein [Stutzerimonas stutzeri]
MKTAWMFGAMVALSALSAVPDAGFALNYIQNGSRYSALTATSPFHGLILVQHGLTFALSKLAFSTFMLVSWLAALRKPAPRPWLQMANRAFVIWLLFQVGLSLSGVAAVLQQVAGIPIAPFSLSGLHLLWNTELRWLIMLFIALPILQLALGEWACRLATRLNGERPERAPANELQRVTL